MATTIKLKNSVTTTNAPSSLVQGEVAINITDKKVWVGNAATTPIQLLGDGGSASFTSIAFGAGTVSNPSITFTGDTNTGIYSPAADTIAFTEGGAEAMRIDSSGNVGIGTNSPVGKLNVYGSSGGRYLTLDAPTNGGYTTFQAGGTAFADMGSYLAITGSGNATDFFLTTRNYPLIFGSNSTERMRIDSSGNVGIGTSSPGSRLAILESTNGNSILNVRNTNAGSSATSILALGNDGALNGAYLVLNSSTNTAGGSGNSLNITNGFNAPMTFATNNTERMRITSGGLVGIGKTPTDKELEIYGATNPALRIQNSTTGTSASDGLLLEVNGSNINFYNYEAGNIQFGTSGSERMRITSGGDVMVAKTTLGSSSVGCELRASGLGVFTASAPSSGVVIINRNTDDGTLIDFRQDNTLEGTITVSGSTVSYNGGHLSRWSQLPNAQKDNTLLKGTVMSNLDDMCVWTKDGEVLPNEQLNKMKVSDVEGDTNVAGVFVNWTRDEDCNSDDMNVAMTGDMIIRIAQGVVVQKGELLMSAGDGTAKPQGDDIRRSKTVAKVTSNHVTCTYADGSYCVPCVLMAC